MNEWKIIIKNNFRVDRFIVYVRKLTKDWADIMKRNHIQMVSHVLIKRKMLEAAKRKKKEGESLKT